MVERRRGLVRRPDAAERRRRHVGPDRRPELLQLGPERPLLGEKAGCFFEVFGDDVTIATEEEGRIVDLNPHFVGGDNKKDDAWDRQYAQFIDAVENGVTPHADGASGRRVQSIIEAIYESSEAQREVELH